MTDHKDLWGLPISAGSGDAVAAWNATILAYLAMRIDIGERLKEAFAADPEMPMALVTKGAFLKMFATAKMDAGAVKTVAQARDVFSRRETTAREDAHLDALAVWVDGEMEEACRRWEAILVDHPRDVLALKLTQLNRFYLGDGAALRDAYARVWHAWDEGVPAYGFIAGSYAFGLEEAGDYDRAEALGRRAVELEPADVWSAHAVAHVMEMQGRSADGLAWLDGLKDHWGAVHNFVHHAHWHRGLFAADMGDYDRALAIFDTEVWTDRVTDYLDLSNGAALLWRLSELGVNIGGRADHVADLAEGLAGDHGLIFSDCHIALAFAMAGRVEHLSAFMEDVDKVAARTGTQPRVLADVGRVLCEAAAADVAGEAGQVADLLLTVRPALYRIGGSRAQRDLYERMLIANALKAGRVPLVRALLSERLENRPGDAWGASMQDRLAA